MLHHSRKTWKRPALRVMIHDYGGHPFVTALSRELAKRDHKLIHAWFAADTGPKGQLKRLPIDPNRLEFEAVGSSIQYSKSNFLKRRQGDIGYGKELAQLIRNRRPDVILSGCTPTEAQEQIWQAGKQVNARLIYWCQDFYSLAASKLLGQRLPGIGHAVGSYYKALERRQMQSADHVVHITHDFCDNTDAWGMDRSHVSVIENWGTLDEIPMRPRNTEWAEKHRLGKGARFLYSGTLAMKHNPALLLELAHALQDPSELLVVAAGSGAKSLSDAKVLPEQMRLMPLQPIDEFPDMLGAADVFLAMIEREAGSFSVPSKTLSYLCAGRPIVLAAPTDNLASRIVRRSKAGIVVEPEDIRGFREAALYYAQTPEAAMVAGAAGRAYAERHFRIDRIADRFEDLFHHVYDAPLRASRHNLSSRGLFRPRAMAHQRS
jgi:colanic acid biosynthesis glycosyl transferase WcaI